MQKSRCFTCGRERVHSVSPAAKLASLERPCTSGYRDALGIDRTCHLPAALKRFPQLLHSFECSTSTG
eukprot:3980332-Amphidinium_carterae.1